MTAPPISVVSKNGPCHAMSPSSSSGAAVVVNRDLLSSSRKRKQRFTTSSFESNLNVNGACSTTTRQQQQLSLSNLNVDLLCSPSTSSTTPTAINAFHLNPNTSNGGFSNGNSLPQVFSSPTATSSNGIIIDKGLAEKDSQKSRCPYQPWNEKTIDHFFDALKQVNHQTHGKDWEAIKKYIAQKSKTGAKNEIQIRNFYHNTMRHLSRLINLNEIDAPKEAKELFMMVNYGELLKKTKSFRIPQHTFAEKFDELVRKGVTSVKFRIMSGKGSTKSGKWLKVKTPVCPALKKYCDNSGSTKTVRKVDKTKLPKSVTLELCPKRHMDKGYVLDCCQNPLIRFSVSLSTTIAEMLTFLQNKWIPPDLRRLKNQFSEDISDKLPTITLYPDSSMTLRLITISTKHHLGGTVPSSSSGSNNFGLQHCFSQQKRTDSTSSDIPGGSSTVCSATTAASTSTKSFAAIGGDEPADHLNLLTVVPQQQQTVFDMYNSADSNDAPTTDDDVEPIEIDAFNISQSEDFDIANDQIITESQQPEIAAVLLNPDQFRNGLSLVNCGDLTVGQLCLMCDGCSKLELVYTIQSKIVSTEEVTPAWLCFVKLVKQEIAGNLHKKPASTANYTAEQSSVESLSPNVPGSQQLKSPVEKLISAPQTSMQTPSRSKKKLSNKNNSSTMSTGDGKARLAKIAPAPPPVPATVVASESEAFFLQFQQMSRKPVVVTRLQAVTPVIAVSPSATSASTVCSTSNGNVLIFGQPVASVQVSSALPPTVAISAGSSSVVTSFLQPNGSNNNNLATCSNAYANLPQQKPPAPSEKSLDFSLGSANSLFGFSSGLSKTADKITDGGKELSNLHNFDSFSFDSSPLKTNSVDDNSLPRDVRRSFELMLHQDSIEYCKNFAALAGNLETPNKCRSPDR